MPQKYDEFVCNFEEETLPSVNRRNEEKSLIKLHKLRFINIYITTHKSLAKLSAMCRKINLFKSHMYE